MLWIVDMKLFKCETDYCGRSVLMLNGVLIIQPQSTQWPKQSFLLVIADYIF